MSARPILFSAPMVRAILRGEKTQTRRPVAMYSGHGTPEPAPRSCGTAWHFRTPTACEWHVNCAFGGEPGDLLWVRETWSPDSRSWYPCTPYVYRADGDVADYETREHITGCGHQRGVKHFECIACHWKGWRPSIHMPREASRITLEVICVRIERLHIISDDDLRAEGVTWEAVHELCSPCSRERVSREAGPREWFRVGWDALNGKRAPWATNPWVWVVTFRKLSDIRFAPGGAVSAPASATPTSLHGERTSPVSGHRSAPREAVGQVLAMQPTTRAR